MPISDLVCVGSQNKWAKIVKLPSLISAVLDFDVRFHDPTLSTFLKTEQKQIILLENHFIHYLNLPQLLQNFEQTTCSYDIFSFSSQILSTCAVWWTTQRAYLISKVWPRNDGSMSFYPSTRTSFTQFLSHKNSQVFATTKPFRPIL